nr:hypothetical protein [Bacteroidota bacterium]
MPIKFTDLQQAVPPVPRQNLLPEIRALLSGSAEAIVVLDDDPTGTQTVYDVPVLTEWSASVIAAEFRLRTPLFFILTNSRSLYSQDAASLAEIIGENLREASRQTGRNFRIISRSDSTLRGHYPVEVDALLHSLGQEEALRIIAPAFFEGGRFTYQNTHYVLENNELVPAGETPFAQDKTFGYQSSDLTVWIEEKTQGKVKAQEVHF